MPRYKATRVSMEVNNAVFLKCNKIGFFQIFFEKGMYVFDKLSWNSRIHI